MLYFALIRIYRVKAPIDRRYARNTIAEVSLIHGYEAASLDNWFTDVSRQRSGLFLKGRNVHEVLNLLTLSYMRKK